MSFQLPLGITWRDHATFNNFYTGKNAQLVSSLVLATEPLIYLWGEAGSGKSHLLQAVCHKASEQGGSQQPLYLPMQELVELPAAMLEGMEGMNPVCIDDVQCIAGNPQWETALFHLFNRLRDQGVRLIISASAAPAQLGIQLPDLVTRLAWGAVYQLQPLDDDGKRVALQQRATQRGLELPDEVVQYVLKRSARDMSSLFELLDKLDAASLAAQRKLTIPFVKPFLD
ncbi:MAG: DnaA regulatory inactivator Hda [Thioalkalispiraceae bacterium]|jgi:DnaA family protein